MSRWAKIHDRIAESNGFAEAANEDSRAALLFLLMLPQCDVYGIIQAGHRVFTAKVCPLLAITPEELDASFACMERHGLVVRYSCPEGRPHLWLPNYTKYQEYRWERVGPPEHPLPPGWQLPKALIEGCQKRNAKGDPEASNALREWVANRQEEEAYMRSEGPLRDHSGTTPARKLERGGEERARKGSLLPANRERRAAACAAGACSPTANGEDDRPKEVRDLCKCLGIPHLPEGWETMCRSWVDLFADKAEGRRRLNDLIAEEADRVRAGGKRKGAPKLAQYLRMRVNTILRDKATYV